MKSLFWFLTAFGPTIVGFCLARWHNNLRGEDPAMLVGVLWFVLNVLCSMVAGIQTTWSFNESKILRTLFGFIAGIAIAVLNVLFTFFGGCVLTL